MRRTHFHRTSLSALALAGAIALAAGAGSASAEAVIEINSCTIVANPTPEHHTACPGADLSYANLAGIDLRFADLSGADLRSADLRNTDLSGSNLSHANLSDANLTNTNFTDSARSAVVLFEREINILGVVVGDLNITTEPEWSSEAHSHAERAAELLPAPLLPSR